MASDHGIVAHLLPQTYKHMISEWLEEDCPGFDYGGFVVGESMAEARLLGKSAVCILFSIDCSRIQAYIMIKLSSFISLIL